MVGWPFNGPVVKTLAASIIYYFTTLTHLVIPKNVINYTSEHQHAIKNIEYLATWLYSTECEDKNPPNM